MTQACCCGTMATDLATMMKTRAAIRNRTIRPESKKISMGLYSVEVDEDEEDAAVPAAEPEAGAGESGSSTSRAPCMEAMR